MIPPRELKEKYKQGQNISALMRQQLGVKQNTREIIEVSYDMQTGSYVDAMSSEVMAKHKTEYSAAIYQVIQSLCQPSSVMEAGVGEATTLSGVLSCFEQEVAGFGFDLSWSRVAYANRWLLDQNVNNTKLCTGDLLNIPFSNDSIDVVYTSHSIEPNGGSEREILRELFRVTRKYLVLLEPGYELASAQARERMDSHGYCKNLANIARELGYSVIEHKLFPVTVNPLNPTALTIISKLSNVERPENVFACPKFKTRIDEISGAFFSPEALVAYPIVGGIPCLRIENGIFASQYEDMLSDT